MNKSNLDDIIEKNKAQPVGHGYIDIIVSRDNYKNFIADLFKNNYKIESISWWEWCSKKNESKYGLGGPVSKYYNGWFSELPIQINVVELEKSINNKEQIDEIVQKIETKTISYPNEIVTFKQNTWLTPALWLKVPENWRNTYGS